MVFVFCFPYSGAVAGRVFVSFQKMAAYRQKSSSCFLVFPLLMVLLMLTGEKWERK